MMNDGFARGFRVMLGGEGIAHEEISDGTHKVTGSGDREGGGG
jgi:hypothetical protein